MGVLIANEYVIEFPLILFVLLSEAVIVVSGAVFISEKATKFDC